jgi:endonuclease/exonuclease/phosphatase family metal-dependent hydrolase
VDGPDLDRHLALLSRLPIVARNSRPDIPFELHGSMEKVRRGILDVTIAINNVYELRLVGAHLKSKLPDPRGETLLRRCEAHLVRQHIETILRGKPDCNLLVYGDLNDTRNEPTIQEIIGPGSTLDHLVELPLQDENGDRWTHYWRVADIYSRIDYIMVSRALGPEIVPASTGIFHGSGWSEASDHRPVITAIRARDSRSKKIGAAFSEN